MTSDTEYIPISEFKIMVDGTEISTDLRSQFREVIIDSNLQVPSMFMVQYDITLQDDSEKTGDKAGLLAGGPFELGKEVAIIIDGQTLIKAEVTALEPEFGEGGHILFTARGYDKSHRLYRGRKTRVFTQQTDDGIVSKVAQEAGLQIQADTTPTTHPHVWQHNQTDMEFIKERARRVGYHVYVDETGELHFTKKQDNGQTVELTWGENLRSFHPRFGVTHQVDKTTVKGWDPAKKEALVGESSGTTNYDPGKQGGESSDGGAVAKQALVTAETALVNYPVLDANEASTLAKALYDRISSGFTRAEGICIGNPEVRAGTIVDIKGLGARFEGKYIVTAATHILPGDGGAYETAFTIRGYQPDVLDYLLDGDNEISKRALITGVVPAIVTSNVDEDDLGRVKVKYPWLDDQLESYWARIAAPGAGITRGMYYIPEVDDEVLIAFEHGDMSRPYILGGLWHSKDTPPKPTGEVVGDGKVNQRILQSRTGHIIIFHDTAGEEKIEIVTQGDHQLYLDDGEKNVRIQTTGGHKVTIDDQNKKIEIKSSGGHTIVLDDQGGKVTVKSTGQVEVEATSDMKLKGVNINVEASANLTLKGTAQTKVEGAQVGINGSAMTEIKGGLVKIN